MFIRLLIPGLFSISKRTDPSESVVALMIDFLIFDGGSRSEMRLCSFFALLLILAVGSSRAMILAPALRNLPSGTTKVSLP